MMLSALICSPLVACSGGGKEGGSAAQLVCTVPAEGAVLFEGTIAAGDLGLGVVDGEGSPSIVELSPECKVSIDDVSGDVGADSVAFEGIGAGDHELSIEVPYKGETLACTVSVTLVEPYGGASDDELLLQANSSVSDMYARIYGMALGAAYDQDWAHPKTLDGVTWYPVKGCSTMKALEDGWYSKFASDYSIEEATGVPLAYREIDGTLYSSNQGIGGFETDFELTEIAERMRNEVVFRGTATDVRSADEWPIEMSLVYEDGQWKYGRWIEVEAGAANDAGQDGADSATEQAGDGAGAATSGNAGGDAAAGNGGGTDDEMDYVEYLCDQLRSRGLLREGQVIMVTNDTESSVTVSVGDDLPDKVTFLGHYTLDKHTLSIYDETMMTYI